MCSNVKNTGAGPYNWLVKCSAERHKEDKHPDTVFFCDKYKYELVKSNEDPDTSSSLCLSDAEHIHCLNDPRLAIHADDPLGIIYLKYEVAEKVKIRLEGGKSTESSEEGEKPTTTPLSWADAKYITDPEDPKLVIQPGDSFKTKTVKVVIKAKLEAKLEAKAKAAHTTSTCAIA